MTEVIIEHNKKLISPSTFEGIKLTRERFGTASSLSVKILAETEISEGDAIRIRVDDENVFFGFIFTINYSGDYFELKAYDQLRYLKNKEFYNYSGKRADEVIKMIASDFRLNVGNIAKTSYVIPSRIENNTTLFDMISFALTSEEMHTGKSFVLYDDFGKLTLKEVSKMKLNLLIDSSSCEGISTTSTIDSKTFNKIKVKDSNGNVYISQDSSTMNKWGILTHVDSLKKGENGKAKADSLLKLYDKPKKSFKIVNALGDLRVRGGSLIDVQFAEGIKSETVLVDKVSFEIFNDYSKMNLTVLGGDYYG